MKNIRAKVLLITTMMAVGVFSEAGELIRFTRATIDTKSVGLQGFDHRNVKEVIVQFQKSATEDDRRFLENRGLQVLGYLPDDAFVVRSSPDQIQTIKSLRSDIQAVIPYLPDFKISADVVSLTAGPKTPEVWAISVFNSEDLESAVQEAQSLTKVQVLQKGSKHFMVLAPRSEIRSLASIYGVEHVQANPEFQSMDMDLGMQAGLVDSPALSGFETGTRIMGFEPAWSQGFTGKNQIVSYADTGLDVGNTQAIHGDFAGAIKAGQALGLFGSGWEDPMGHGTHVAGSIAGRGSLSSGQLRGGAFEAMIVAQSMWSSMMDNLMPPSKLEKLFSEAQKEGAILHSNSWGSPRDLGAYDSFAQQVDEWIFRNPDLLVLFAAGNSGVDKNKDGRIDSGSIGSPATAKNVVSVGASENTVTTGGIQVPVKQLRAATESWGAEPIYSSMISDRIDGLAMFSSRGPTRDGRLKPDIVAPGTNILSTKSQHPKAQDLWGRWNDKYIWSGGTSMATPLAAGAAAVARQYVQEKMGVRQPSSALLKAVLMHNAVDMFPGQYGEVGESRGQEFLSHRPNPDEGYGRVDVSAITSMGSNSHLIDERGGVGANEEKVYTFEMKKGFSLLANLVYNDAPASPNSAQALVNDLDLVLVKPDGTQVAPADHINNHEILELAGLPAGSYKLIVRGAKVPQGLNGRQPFALIFTVR